MDRLQRACMVLLVSVLLTPACRERVASPESVVDLVELRERGILLRFSVAPVEGTMLWLDKGATTGVVWDPLLRTPPDGAPAAGGVPVVRTILDWSWDGSVLRVNGAITGARVPGASPPELEHARVVYTEGCPGDEVLALLPAGPPGPGRVLVVNGCAWTRERMAAVLPRVRGLVARGGSVAEDAFRDLPAPSTGLVLLYLEKMRLLERHLLDLAPVASALIALSLADTELPFSDGGAADVLAGLGRLRFLDLSGTGLRDADLTRLARRGPPLEELRLRQTWLSAARLDKVSRIPSLRALDLSNTRADASTLERFDALPRLRRLDLRASAVEDPGAASLARLDTLVELDLPFWLTDAAAPALGGLRELRVLRARATRLTGQGLRSLGALENLLFLELNHVNVDDAGLEGLLGAASLEILEVEHTPLTDEGMKILARMPQLRKAEIEETNVSDAGLGYLVAAPALEVLMAQELPRVTDAGMVHVPAFPKLRFLSLDECELTDAAVAPLSRATSLQVLSVATTRISPEGRARLREALPGAELR